MFVCVSPCSSNPQFLIFVLEETLMVFFYLFLFILSMVLMGFFAGSETAIISANRLKLYSALESPDKKRRKLAHLLNDTQKLLIITLVGTNISLVFGTFIAKEFLRSLQIEIFKSIDIETIASLIILPPIFLVFCEIVPKSIFRMRADTLIYKLTGLLSFSSVVFTPLVKILTYLTNHCLRIVGIKKGFALQKLTREDLVEIVEESERIGAIEDSEKEMIHSIFDLERTAVREVMKPLIDVIAININETTVEELKDLARRTGYTRFPVYEDLIINLIGYVDLYHIFACDDIDKRRLKDFVQEPYFIPESKRIDHLLEEFLEKRLRLAIAIDEYGSCVGIITREDIMEEIVGEIEDEFDQPAPPEFRVVDNAIICDAKMDIDDVNETFGLSLPKKDYETLSGFIYNELGRVPEVGDRVTYDNVKFEVISMDKQKIEKVKIEK